MPVIADRNLLFGLLALQVGLIGQDQLLKAFRAWSRDKSRRLADLLMEQGDLGGARRALLEALVDEHLAEHQGDLTSSLSAMNVGRSTRMELERIHDGDLEATLGHAGTSPHPDSTDVESDPDRTAPCSVGMSTSDGRRFRVLRPHARGGLGALYVALDSELRREVALKQILDDHADDPASRARFLLEAEVTGGLEHPGIVPVYGLGSYADGRPFYATRFIRGDSLKEAIVRFHRDGALMRDRGRRSLELRRLLRRFTDVCNAIEYAHSRGVLHRDIKPANIIVGKHGETLVVDWGLAKVTGRGDGEGEEPSLVPGQSSGSADTLPGSALGTPAYMSPEQARGELEALGPGADVYSLGATLYCLLCGRPPVEDEDVGVVLRAVQRGEFSPPRALDPTIDRALEAVCLKAMALRPQDRYLRPRQLAEDVERWMADEAVTAWREPRTRALTRWLARHRTGVTAAGAAVLVALVGTAAVLGVQARLNRDLASALGRERSANAALAAAKSRAEVVNEELKAANLRESERSRLALDAIRLFHDEASEDLVLKQKPFDGLRTKLLRGAADFYGKLEGLLKTRTDRDSRRELGNSYSDLAELTAKFGTWGESLTVHRKALAVRRELAAQPGADSETSLDVVRSLLAIGQMQQYMKDRPGMTASYVEALTLAERLDAGGQGTDQVRFVLAKALLLNALLADGKDPTPIMAMYRRALAYLVALAGSNPTNQDFRDWLARCHNQIGVLLNENGKPAEAISAYREARRIRETIVATRPEVPEYGNELAIAISNTSAPLKAMGRMDEALEAESHAVALWSRLADANPVHTTLRNNLAYGLEKLAWLESDAGLPGHALETFRRALKAREVLSRPE